MGRKDFYTHNYTAFEFDERKRRVLALASLYRGRVRNFLDIGCGDGTFSLLLKEVLGAQEAHGVEISPLACALSMEKGLRVLQLDIDEIERLPYADATLDLVHAGQVIEHVFETDRFLTEVHRVLKPEGICILSTPNLGSWYNRVALLLGFQPYNTSVSVAQYKAGKLFRRIESVSIAGAEHLRVGTLRAWKELFEGHHFTIAQVHGISVSRSGVPALIRFVDRALGAVDSLASVLVFILSKR